MYNSPPPPNYVCAWFLHVGIWTELCGPYQLMQKLIESDSYEEVYYTQYMILLASSTPYKTVKVNIREWNTVWDSTSHMMLTKIGLTVIICE